MRRKPRDEIKSGGFGPFITWVVRFHPEKGFLHQTSRRLRKTNAAAVAHPVAHKPHDALSRIRHHWLKVFAPRDISWWIAVLFMIGATHFAIASAASLWPKVEGLEWIHGPWIDYVYFSGSFFFTSAAYCQWLQALNNSLDETSDLHERGKKRWRFVGWRGRNLGYLSSAVQLAGTIFFNFNTGDAIFTGDRWQDYDALVWTPNFFGSICFLVASQLAVMEFSHTTFSFKPKAVSWWIVIINLLGSILFMISAMTSIASPQNVLNIPLIANIGTFGGAICFFTAAYLLIPEFFEKDAVVEPT